MVRLLLLAALLAIPLAVRAGDLENALSPNKKYRIDLQEGSNGAGSDTMEVIETATGKVIGTLLSPAEADYGTSSIFVLWSPDSTCCAASINVRRIGETRIAKLSNGAFVLCKVPSLEINHDRITSERVARWVREHEKPARWLRKNNLLVVRKTGLGQLEDGEFPYEYEFTLLMKGTSAIITQVKRNKTPHELE